MRLNLQLVNCQTTWQRMNRDWVDVGVENAKQDVHLTTNLLFTLELLENLVLFAIILENSFCSDERCEWQSTGDLINSETF